MIVDNFDIIKEFIMNSCDEQHIDFNNDPDSYYEIRIITRNKDFGEKGHSKDFSYTYYIFKLNDMDTYKENIIKLCNLFNARAYFGIRRKSLKRVLLNCNIEIAKNLAGTSYSKPWKLVERVSNFDSSSKDKKWIIDIDTKDTSYVKYIHKTFEDLGGKCYCELPTPHGYHIITSPFKFEQYKKKLELDKKQISNVKKNNITLIYANVLKNEN